MEVLEVPVTRDFFAGQVVLLAKQCVNTALE
jgi:hypothetical protein